MRILHTADWHLNHRLGRIDRNEDITRALRQIAAYLEQYEVDVMVVAGDLFHRVRMDELRQGIALIRQIFLPFLERGGTMVAISGNHDSETLFETLRDAADMVMPVPSGGSGRAASSRVERGGRLYLAPNPRLLRLAGRDGTVVQFVLMPYPSVRTYLRGEPVSYNSVEEKHRAIQDKFMRALDLLQQPEHGFDVTQQAVLVSHVHVRGVDPHPLFHLTEAEDVVFEPGAIPAHWAYVAYGHIHQAQEAMKGAGHVRYSGSVERMDFGEALDEKSVVLLEIGSRGLRSAPQILPLASTPIYRIEVTDPLAQIPRLAENYPDAAHALVSYTLHWQAGVHDRDALCQEIQAIFPRWTARKLVQMGSSGHIAGSAEGSTGPEAARHLDDVSGNVRDYLKSLLAERDDWNEVMALAEELLAQEPIDEEQD